MRHIISILLQNEAGALARVANMFSARGYNIESLSVAPTEDESVSRLTLATSGSAAVIDQILKQLGKLVDVVQVVDYAGRDFIEFELLMLKLKIEGMSAREVVECVWRHRGLILDESESTRTILLTGTGAEIDAFVAEVGRIAPILELVRTGAAALQRGDAVLRVPVAPSPAVA